MSFILIFSICMFSVTSLTSIAFWTSLGAVVASVLLSAPANYRYHQQIEITGSQDEQVRSITTVQHNMATVERGRKRPTPTKSVGHFKPLSSTVLFGRFATAKCPHRTPQKTSVKLGGYPYANDCKRNTNQYRLHPVSQR